MLNDPVTAQYTHTLTVTTAGEYTCTVSHPTSITVTGILKFEYVVYVYALIYNNRYPILFILEEEPFQGKTTLVNFYPP